MSARVPFWAVLAMLMAFLVILVTFGALVRVGKGPFGKAALTVAAIPDTLTRLLPAPALTTATGNYPALPAGLWRNTAQPFVDPGYLLLTARTPKRPVIQLVRLSDGATLRTYAPDVDAVNARSRFTSEDIVLRRDRDSSRNLMMHPLLMPDGGLVIHDSSPLARFDACGKLVWMVDGIFHHSVEMGPDGSIWAAYRFPKPVEQHVRPRFADEAIAHVSADGHLLGLDRIADILDRNGMGAMWRSRPYTDDPFHLNDVEPLFDTTRYWQRGDLMVSIRSLSLVMIYRPTTGKVIWWKSGPWSAQHDVTPIDDHRISIFDNHWRYGYPEGDPDGNNRIAIYDFATDKVSFVPAITEGHAIHTRVQGRATPLANGDFMVEETLAGRIIRAAPDGTLRWRFISADTRRRRFELRWSRYLEPVSQGPSVRAAMEATCT